MADDQTGTTGQGDAYNEPIPAQDASVVRKSELPPQNEIKQPVSHGAIPVVSLDDLLAPSPDTLPAPKVIPPITVMPRPVAPAPTSPAPHTPVAPAAAPTPATTPASVPGPASTPHQKPIPPEVEPFIRKTTQPVRPPAPPAPIATQVPAPVPPIQTPVPATPPARPTPSAVPPAQTVVPKPSAPATPSPKVPPPAANPPVPQRVTPTLAKPAVPKLTIPQSVIVSETLTKKVNPVPPPPVAPKPAPVIQAAPAPTPPPVVKPSAPVPKPIDPMETVPVAKANPIVSAPAPTPAKSWGPFRDNIANILNAIKLPERFDIRASGDLKNRASQDAAEPIIISETVRPTSKPAPATNAQAPAPVHFANEAPPVVPPPAPKPVAQTPVKDAVPDVGLPNHTINPAPTPVAPIRKIPILPDPPPFSPPVIRSAPPVPPPPIAPTPAPAPATPATSESALKDAPQDHSVVTPLRTFKEDLMHVVHDRKISLVSAVAMEEDKKRDVKQPSPEEIAIIRHRRRRNFAILYTAVILFGLSVAALFGVYTVQNQHATPAPNPNSTSIIFAEQTFSFPLQDLSPSDIKRTLGQSHSSSNASLGSITRIIPTVKTPEGGARAATTAEFFKAIDVHVSDDLVRALSSEFFLGVHTIDKNSTVLIIPVYSYERAFAGMLEWEASMNTDLAPAFTPVPAFKTDENGLPQRRLFEDVVMRNYDTRALRDDSNAIQLYYSFPTPNILIISENPFSFTEILSRLQVQRRL